MNAFATLRGVMGVAAASIMVLAGGAQASTTHDAVVASFLTDGPKRGGMDVATGIVSSNWAGYAVTDAAGAAPAAPSSPDPNSPVQPTMPTSFTSVTGTWQQPRATCSTGSDASYSAVWVGLGGFSSDSRALEQIGTAADCTASGRSVYYAWYELVPAPPVNLRLKIVPGDTITTSVNSDGSTVLVQIKDRTRRTSFTRRLNLTLADLSSSEWIVEAPSQCSPLGNCQALPLANFGSVAFTRIATTGKSHAGTLSDPAWSATPIQLVPGTAKFFAPAPSPSGAKPSDFTADGRSFGVQWLEDATRAASP